MDGSQSNCWVEPHRRRVILNYLFVLNSRKWKIPASMGKQLSDCFGFREFSDGFRAWGAFWGGGDAHYLVCGDDFMEVYIYQNVKLYPFNMWILCFVSYTLIKPFLHFKMSIFSWESSSCIASGRRHRDRSCPCSISHLLSGLPQSLSLPFAAGILFYAFTWLP